MRKVDLAIIGGGCAGLSLASELVKAEKCRLNVPSTIVIEPRVNYTDDRSWSFWSPSDAIPLLVSKKWDKWSFSGSGLRFLHQSKNWAYCYVRSLDFYNDASQRIAKSRQVKIKLGTKALEVTKHKKNKFLIETSNGKVIANYLVDTRPPKMMEFEKSQLFQQFSGAEIECHSGEHETLCAGLMENLATDHLGIRFDYHLPLSRTRMLVEATRFTPEILPATELENDLEQSLIRFSRGGNFSIIRKEQGSIPMGLPSSNKKGNTRWVMAGTSGGAVRASTGYAFRRIGRWARCCAERLCRQGEVLAPSHDRLIQKGMDSLFLTVLRKFPELGPKFILRMAERVPAESFVRFLSDKGDFKDFFSIIKALPPGPFLASLLQLKRAKLIPNNAHK